MEKKYLLNTKTKKYHMIGYCYNSKNYNLKRDPHLKEYDSEEQILKEYQNYVCRCKNCFKGQ